MLLSVEKQLKITTVHTVIISVFTYESARERAAVSERWHVQFLTVCNARHPRCHVGDGAAQRGWIPEDGA